MDGLAPTEQSILVDPFPPAQHNVAFAVTGVAMAAAPMLGPTILQNFMMEALNRL